MVKAILLAASILSTFSAARAEPLTDQDKAFVIAAIGGLRVLSDCQGYEAVTNSMLRLGDTIGVDPVRIGAAVNEALHLGAGMEYDRTKLIPEVTRLMNETFDAMTEERNKNKVTFCKRWSDAMIKMGVIQRKS